MNVLEVMDCKIREAEQDHKTTAVQMREARATVAELIEQAQVARVKLQLAGYETRELDAALARAGGEK